MLGSVSLMLVRVFQKPDTMVSYNSPGTGSLGAFRPRTEFSKCPKTYQHKRFQPTTSQKVGYNPSGRTPTKTTPGKEDGRTIGSTLINKGLNAITNQKDSVSSKKKPTKTPEPTGSARVTASLKSH